MAKRVVLHIGAMKSGTSFIQNVLDTNRGVLAEHGILWARPRWRLQVLAVKELIEHGGEDQPPLPTDGYWQQLVDEVNAWPGTAVISMEFLAPRRRPKIEIIQRAFEGADLQVVLTARDLVRSVPAMWIETVQNRGTRTWPEFLAAVRSEDRSQKPARWFWSHQRISAISRRWADVVGRDHFTLVTVPQKGAPPSLLWERFASVAGIPADLCRTDVRSNPGLDAASAMVLRALNERLEQSDFSVQQYERLVKGDLAKSGLVRRGRDTIPLGLDERWVRKRSKQDVERLRKLDLRVVGDLEELRGRAVPGVHTRQVTAQQQLDASLDAITYLLTSRARRRGQAQAAPAGESVPAGETADTSERISDEPVA